MPVTLHYVDQARWEAEEQVRIDLIRIYEDAPLKSECLHQRSPLLLNSI